MNTICQIFYEKLIAISPDYTYYIKKNYAYFRRMYPNSLLARARLFSSKLEFKIYLHGPYAIYSINGKKMLGYASDSNNKILEELKRKKLQQLGGSVPRQDRYNLRKSTILTRRFQRTPVCEGKGIPFHQHLHEDIIVKIISGCHELALLLLLVNKFFALLLISPHVWCRLIRGFEKIPRWQHNFWKRCFVGGCLTERGKLVSNQRWSNIAPLTEAKISNRGDYVGRKKIIESLVDSDRIVKKIYIFNGRNFFILYLDGDFEVYISVLAGVDDIYSNEYRKLLDSGVDEFIAIRKLLDSGVDDIHCYEIKGKLHICFLRENTLTINSEKITLNTHIVAFYFKELNPNSKNISLITLGKNGELMEITYSNDKEDVKVVNKNAKGILLSHFSGRMTTMSSSDFTTTFIHRDNSDRIFQGIKKEALNYSWNLKLR